MKRSTLFLKIVIYVLGLGALAFCIFALPAGINSVNSGMYRPILYGMYITAIPFFIALHQSMKLLNLIDSNKAFSHISVRALNKIKYCAISISVMYAAGMPYIYYVANRDDAPGVAALGFVIIGASIVVAVFAAVLQRLLKNAIDIKSENDLTV